MDDLSFIVLEECAISELTKREDFYIKLCQFERTNKPYFNIKNTAIIDVCKPPKREETIKKSSEFMKEWWSIGENRERQRESHKGERPERRGIPSPHRGEKRPKEWGENISKAKTGKERAPFGVEWINNMSERWKGEKNPNFGGNMSAEHKLLLAKASKEIYETDEGRERLDRARELSVLSNTGKPKSEETKRKISEGIKRAWVKKRQNNSV
jgi:hypothetical protein